MHGQALALTPQNDRLVRLDDGSLPRAYVDDDFGPRARGIDLQSLWAMVVRNRVLMGSILLLALLAGLASIWLIKPVYTAQATIQIEPQVPRIVGTEEVTPDAGRTESERLLQTQADLLSSRSTANNVVQKLKLTTNPRYLREVGLANSPAGVLRDAAVTTALQERLSVSTPRNTRLVTIDYESQDPVLAARVANTVAETFINDNLQRRLDTYNYSRTFLQGQLQATKARLELSERNLVNYSRAAGLVDAGNAAGVAGSNSNGDRRSIISASLVDLNSAYSQAQANRMQAQQRWQQAMATPAMSLPDVLNNPAIQNLSRERADLEASLQEERQRRQDEHPAVIQAQAQIAELDRQIATIAGGVRASIGNQYRVAAGQEASLKGTIDSLKSATFAEAEKGVQYNVLKREADTNRNLYNTLLQRYQEVSTQAANMINPISIIDRAQVPSAPAYPRPALNMALATLIGIALALAAGFTRNRRDKKVHGPATVENDFHMPLLGVVPKLKHGETIAEALDNPLSRITEAHHAITLALDPVTRTTDHSVVLLTSCFANEGKSMTAFKLAANLAAAGKNVLMIDGDMRCGTLHKLLNLSNQFGLADLLSKGSDQPLMSAVQHCEEHGFSVLARGRPSANPAELLASNRFRTLLEDAVRQYDAVIIDGPPVLGLADAPRLSSVADATVFVIEANRTSKDDAKIALKRLGDAGADQIGLVISKYDPDKDIGAPGYAYRYDYYASEESDANYEEQSDEAGRQEQLVPAE